jgi:hypothetical protein
MLAMRIVGLAKVVKSGESLDDTSDSIGAESGDARRHHGSTC